MWTTNDDLRLRWRSRATADAVSRLVTTNDVGGTAAAASVA